MVSHDRYSLNQGQGQDERENGYMMVCVRTLTACRETPCLERSLIRICRRRDGQDLRGIELLELPETESTDTSYCLELSLELLGPDNKREMTCPWVRFEPVPTTVVP